MILQSSVIDQKITIQDCIVVILFSILEKHWLLYDLYPSVEANGDTLLWQLYENNLVRQTKKMLCICRQVKYLPPSGQC